MTLRKRILLVAVPLLVAAGLYVVFSGQPDRDAILALLADAQAAIEAEDLERMLPAIRQDFALGGGATGTVTYQQLAATGNALLRNAQIRAIEVRNVEVEIDGDHAVITATIHVDSRDRLLSARPLPMRIELTRSGEPSLYRGWRLYRVQPASPTIGN